MKRTIYLHPGLWKCGSSSIQSFCELNRENLLKLGFCYPENLKSKRLMGTDVPFLHEIGNLLMTENSVQAKRTLENFLSKVSEKNIILSGENFLEEPVPEKLGYLFNQYKEIFDFKVIIYLRPFIEHIVSSWHQAIRVADPSCKYLSTSLESYIEEKGDNVYNAVYEHIKLYEAYFGIENIIIQPFEKEQFVEGDLIKDFLSVCNISDFSNLVFPSKNDNVSLDRVTLEKLRYINKTLGHLNIDWPNCLKIKRNIVSQCDIKNKQPLVYSLNPKDIVKIAQRFSKIENCIADKYLRRDKLFTRDYSKDCIENKSEYKGLSVDDMLQTQTWIQLILYDDIVGKFTQESVKLRNDLTKQVKSEFLTIQNKQVKQIEQKHFHGNVLVKLLANFLCSFVPFKRNRKVIRQFFLKKHP